MISACLLRLRILRHSRQSIMRIILSLGDAFLGNLWWYKAAEIQQDRIHSFSWNPLIGEVIGTNNFAKEAGIDNPEIAR